MQLRPLAPRAPKHFHRLATELQLQKLAAREPKQSRRLFIKQATSTLDGHKAGRHKVSHTCDRKLLEQQSTLTGWPQASSTYN
eukprot:scaffold232493_cov18-Tisochrysis_lutea.AAC.2